MIRRTVPFADGALLPLTAVLTGFGVMTIYRLDPDDGGTTGRLDRGRRRARSPGR